MSSSPAPSPPPFVWNVRLMLMRGEIFAWSVIKICLHRIWWFRFEKVREKKANQRPLIGSSSPGATWFTERPGRDGGGFTPMTAGPLLAPPAPSDCATKKTFQKNHERWQNLLDGRRRNQRRLTKPGGGAKWTRSGPETPPRGLPVGDPWLCLLLFFLYIYIVYEQY